eukprot:TRINITY_DN14984_c0_g1_i2.p1 TRINITY_DN14984_c0_g1~~TRINITY_DN14984_c0_g1_i2.p1  ORF type:complete len:442 (+),score=43.42 TRINITY_DN14984_c0_g1_i2:166-1491(+)
MSARKFSKGPALLEIKSVIEDDDQMPLSPLSPSLGKATTSFFKGVKFESPKAGHGKTLTLGSGLNLTSPGSTDHTGSIISTECENAVRDRFLQRTKTAAFRKNRNELPLIAKKSFRDLKMGSTPLTTSFNKIPKAVSFRVTPIPTLDQGSLRQDSTRKPSLSSMNSNSQSLYDCSDLPLVSVETTSGPSVEEKRKEILKRGVRILRTIGRARFLTNVTVRKTLSADSGKEKSDKQKSSAKAAEDPEDSILQLIQQNSGMGMALPTASDLIDLPAHLRTTFTQLARETFRKFLYPRALLWLRQKDRNRLSDSSLCPPMTLEILQRQELFKNCPQERLVEMIPSLILTVFKKNEFLIHEREQAGSGIFFVMTGSVAVYKKENSQCKRIGCTNGTLLAKLFPMSCVGEFAFLTEEPRMATIMALERVECWVLRKKYELKRKKET